MARTRAEWNETFTSPAGVAGLSLSAVAEWLGLRDLVVGVAMAFETIFEILRSDVDSKIDNKQPGSIYWYPGMVKEFQYGDSLIVEDGIVKYAVIDTEAQIVTQASVKETDDGRVIIKVAKDDSGEKVQLTEDELTALRTYVEARKSPGVKTSVVSNAADVVKYTLTARFDKNMAKTEVQSGLNAALTAFRDNFSFDAIFYRPQLIEDLMGVAGMKSLLLQIDMTLSNGNTVTNLAEYTELPAGYFNWDETSTITLIAAP